MNDLSWGFVAILLTIACAAFFPLGLIVLAPALLFGGLSARRRSRDARTSGMAAGAIAGGIAGIVLIVVLLAATSFWFSTSLSSDGGSPSGGPFPATPQAVQHAPAP